MEEIKNLISHKRIADIGCDHGKIVVRAFEEGIISYAVLSDISEICAKKPKLLLDKIPNANYEIRVGNGLATLKKSDNIKEVLITGMGGEEIIKILQHNNLAIQSFILQPQKNEDKLKLYLLNNGYKIVFDKIIKDGKKFYNILRAEPGSMKVNNKNILFGLNNKGTKDFKLYLNYLKNKITKLIPKIKDKNKLVELKEKLKLIEGELNE